MAEVEALLADVKRIREACEWWYGPESEGSALDLAAIQRIEAFIQAAAHPKPVALSEALEALGELKCFKCSDVGEDCPHAVVKRYLEASAQEAEDWADIARQFPDYIVMGPPASAQSRWEVVLDCRDKRVEFYGDTRQAALALAAAWAREELKKETR